MVRSPPRKRLLAVHCELSTEYWEEHLRSNRAVYTSARRRGGIIAGGCGCLLIFGIGVLVVVAAALILRPNLSGIVAQIAGFRSEGSTAQVFTDVTPAPTVELINPTQPPEVVLNLGEYGTRQLDPNSNLYDFTIGELPTGGQAAVATFTEAGLMDICRAQSPLCSDNPPDPRIRDPRIDLRPGGAVIAVDVTLPELGNITQTVGIVLRLDDTRRQFEFAGIDINGGLFTAPPESFAATITELETRGNELLRALSVQAGGGQYTLSEVRIDDATLMVVLR